MTSGPLNSTDVSDLRKELILAQIRLMELEDQGEALLAKLASLESQFDALQELTEAKLSERNHFQQIAASLTQQLNAVTQELEELREVALQKERFCCKNHRESGTREGI